ncbi:DUF11 domain-containing protein [Marinicella rhabdoformis]|uniref:COG1361 S-layer family protein n=1 Tax=Marinicella rhabdoformis TaxID=2580566 RepID=UPI0012AEBE59|nr:DUF11 domain-containing protein [Marinicella rhabdoformis]
MNQTSPFKLFVFFAVLLSGSVFAAKGKDGNDTIAANTVVNYYDSVTNIQNGANVIVTVNNINTLTDIQGLYTDANLSAGDKVMLYQAQGATYSTANDSSPTYGAFNLNAAGRYEVHEVLSVSGNDITLAEFGNLCTADQLIYSFDLTKTQLIRMPQFNDLTINGGSVVSAAPWNGSTGGIVAIDVAGILNLAGQIDVSGLGFRGGVLENSSSPSGADRPSYYYINQEDGAEKGEGILGFQAEYDAYGGRYGRGAPANGGGGGNGHNAGGGGGANGGDIADWNGQGNPNLSDNSWTAAWDIDGTLTSATTSSGGGRGGYTYGSSNQNALTVPPGDTNWGGNSRRERGGMGGRPLPFDDAGRLFFGGGGGAGDGNNNQGANGGAGGGLVFITAATVSGAGSILANGLDGEDTQGGGNNDAPGGAGAGGTVVIASTTLSGIGISANGGAGGNQLTIGDENEGPGGGGGGGVISVSGGVIATSALGGVNGTTASTAMTEFIPNGATMGAVGQPDELTSPEADLPICVATADLAITKMDSVDPVNPGGALTYTIRVDNAGPAAASNVVVTESLPAGVTLVSTSGCAEDPNGVPTCSLGDIPATGFATYTVAVTVNNNATGTLTNNVSVTSDTPDPDTSDNNTDETTTVNPQANISITKSDSVDPVNPGGALTYTIRVDNAGPATANNVVVTESLPAGVTFVSTSGCTEDPAGVPTCSLGNIASGGFATYTVAVNVNNNATGTLTNNVSVTSDTPDPDTSDNNTDETTGINDEADLSITKTDSVDPVNPGGALTYTIRVDNAGPATASNVVVTESLPAGVTFVSTSGCTEDPAGVPTCSLGNIASGGFATYTVAVNVNNNASGTLTNNVSVTSDTTDPDTSNNNTDETTGVNDAANLSITKTDSADPVTPGDALTYTIRVDNAGPATASNVVVTEALPAGVTLVSTSGCTEDPNGVPTCSLGNIASGGFATYTVAVNVNNNASGTLTNNVSVTSDTLDPDTSDNNTDETTVVGDAANLSITKTDSADPVTAGDALTYTIRVDNAGPNTANNVVVTESLPADVTLVSTSGCTEDPSGVPTCSLGNIVSGGFATYTVAVNVNNNATGTLTNNVSVTSDTPDPDTSDNNTDETTGVNEEADLSITKTDSADPVTPGDALTYTIRVDNAGPSLASNVVVTEVLPAGVTFVSTVGCTEDPNGVPTCSLGDIASGGFATYTVAVNVNNNASGTLTNNVSVTSDTTDPDTSNNNTDETTGLNDAANLSITKTDSADPVTPGDALTYTIRVDNAGPSTANNVVVTEALPADVTLVSTSGCTEDPNGVPTCSLGNIASGGFATYTVAVTVNNNASGILTNNVSVTSDTPDPDTSDNNTDETTIIGDAANLSITKTDSVDPVNPGGALTYTIRVDNAGPATATNVVVAETLPTDVTLVSTSGCTEDPNGVPNCSLGDIVSGGFAQYTVAVTVNNNATGTLTNNVSVTSDTPDPDTSDNNTDETTGVNAPSLEVEKSMTNNADEDGSGTVTLDDTLTYTITATNNGDTVLNNVVVSDPMITPSSTSCLTLAIGAECQLVGTYVVQQSDVNNGQVENTGTGESDETSPETDVVVTVIGVNPDLSIDKTLTANADEDGNGVVTLGDTVTFTIVATNTGNVDLNNVVVDDDMITPGSTSCLLVPVGGTCTLVGTYVIQQSDVDNGQLTNIATAGSDETGQQSDTTDLTITVGFPPEPAMVPSSTVWGQLLMVLMMMGLGLVVVRRQH